MGRWRGRGSGKWSNSAKKLTSAKKKSKPAWSGNSFGTSSWGMGSRYVCLIKLPTVKYSVMPNLYMCLSYRGLGVEMDYIHFF